MNNETELALLIATGTIGIGLVTARQQIIGLRQLAARKLVPSDELEYLRGRHRRRLLNSAIFLVIGLLIALSYLSGMEAVAGNLPEHFNEGAEPPVDGKPRMTEAQKNFLRFWSSYWLLIVGLVFALMGIAIRDAIAGRRYWHAQYKRLREEQDALLRRDLAVHRSSHEARRGRRGRLPPSPEIDTE